MKITEKAYNWNGNLAKRYLTNFIILHHRAGDGDVESIHNQHIQKGWTGIGYHFYVRKDGSVYAGRPLDVWGSHCIGYNDRSIGVCFEGNFEKEEMPNAQIKSGQELIAYLRRLYPSADVLKHQDLVSSACPGKEFPYYKIKNAEIKRNYLESANDIIWELKEGKHKIEINEVDRAVKTLDKARKENSSLYWILYKLVNKED